MPETYATQLRFALPQIQTAYTFAQKNITDDLIFSVAQRLADVRAPSGTVSFTIGPEIKNILEDFRVDKKHTTFTHDYLRTGNPVFEINPTSNMPSTIFFAHGDRVSYVVEQPGTDEVSLSPKCAHRQAPATNVGDDAKVQFPGQALRLHKDSLEIITDGQVVTDQKGGILFVTDHGHNPELKKDDRVIFNPLPGESHRLKKDGQNAVGDVDNTFGLAATLLMATTMIALQQALPKLNKIKTIVVADDNEEGPPTGEFGLGAQAFVKVFHLNAANRHIVVDGHDGQRDNLPSKALLAKVVSRGKGVVMNNRRFNKMNMLVRPLKDIGANIDWDQNVEVSTSRSSDWGLRNAKIPDTKILVAGYSEAMPHHNDLAPAVASIPSAVELSRFLVALNVAASFGLI